MQKRILLLPIIWGAYGIGEVLALNYFFGPIIADLASFNYPVNDKPIGGAYLPALFFNVTALLAMLGFSLWAVGMWEVDFSSPKFRRDIIALGVMVGSGMLIFTSAIFLFPLMATVVYFLATNID